MDAELATECATGVAAGMTERSVDQLADDLLAADLDELDARIRELELLRRRVEAELALTIGRAAAAGLPDVDGHRSMKGYLRATCNWSNPTVAAHRRLARAYAVVPGLADAVHAGRVGLDQATVLAKLAANPRIRARVVECAEMLLEIAERYDFEDFHRAAQRFEMLADADGAHRDLDSARAARNARVLNVGGELHLDATGGDPLVNDELAAIFQRFVEHEFRADAADRRERCGDDSAGEPLRRSHQQRCYDAFVDLMRRADRDLTATPGSVPAPPRPRTNVVVDAHTFGAVLAANGLAPDASVTGERLDPFTGLPADDLPDLLALLTTDPTRFVRMRCETSTGTPLHPHHVLRAVLAGTVRRIVLDGQGVPIDLGRSSRLFTGAAREAATLLVHHCDHAGCDLPEEFCEVDHITEWSDHGATDQINAAVDCGYHNRLKHRRRFSTRRATDGRRYTVRPDGTIVLAVGVRPPTFPSDRDDADSECPPHSDGAADPDAA